MSNSAVLYHAMYYSTVAEEPIIQYIRYRTGLFLWYNTPYWYYTGTVPTVIILVMYQQDPWVPYSTILHIPLVLYCIESRTVYNVNLYIRIYVGRFKLNYM